MQKKAVILLSGGLDSATVLALAKEQGYDCYTMSFDYGQKSHAELNAAKAVSRTLGAIEHRVMTMSLGALGGSALTDSDLEIPQESDGGVPITYVPARNTVFLSFALAWAEVLGARDLFIGVNDVDYSGYPDCRPAFIDAFEKLANAATDVGTENPYRIHAPLQYWSKAKIVQEGVRLGVDYSVTVSCYQADEDGRACNACDSCRLRALGFKEAEIDDPTRYQ